ncbi:hypothetical protein B6U91_01780 [Candidatus Pacearchaeota archaeon ex4484_71]|nr:MAG: hypothetical protein B6U91_01780 [Candidatus Pacearchaeota archaeon ex4484_71]
MLILIFSILFGAKVILFFVKNLVIEDFVMGRSRHKKKKMPKGPSKVMPDNQITWIAHGKGPCLQTMTTLYKEASMPLWLRASFDSLFQFTKGLMSQNCENEQTSNLKFLKNKVMRKIWIYFLNYPLKTELKGKDSCFKAQVTR